MSSRSRSATYDPAGRVGIRRMVRAADRRRAGPGATGYVRASTPARSVPAVAVGRDRRRRPDGAVVRALLRREGPYGDRRRRCCWRSPVFPTPSSPPTTRRAAPVSSRFRGRGSRRPRRRTSSLPPADPTAPEAAISACSLAARHPRRRRRVSPGSGLEAVQLEALGAGCRREPLADASASVRPPRDRARPAETRAPTAPARRRAAPARRSRPRARAPARAASPRATGSGAAADRADRCRSRGRRGSPRTPTSPSFPKPATTRPSGSAPASSSVRPAWFSKPASVRRAPPPSSHSSSTSPIMPPLAGDGLERQQPGAGHPRAVAAAVAAAEQLVAAADGEHGPPPSTAARIASPRCARSGAISACSRSWPPPT